MTNWVADKFRAGLMGAFHARILDAFTLVSDEIRLSAPFVSNGSIWTRSIVLPSGTDVRTITRAGKYEVGNPVGAPMTGDHLWFLTVDVATNGDIRLEMTLERIGVVSTIPTTWVSQRRNNVWSRWGTTSGFVFPEHFGATGDGAVDDSSPVEFAVRSGMAVKLHGLYKLTRSIAFGEGYSGATSCIIEGQGKRHFVLDAADARLNFGTGTAGSFGENKQIVARDFVMISNRTDHIVGALTLTGGVGSGSTAKTFDIRNVGTYGADATKSTLHGIHVINGRNGVIDGCTHQGKRSGEAAGSRTGMGVKLEGTHDPVDFTIVNNHAYFCASAIQTVETMEGLTIDKCAGVAIDYGVYADWDENPLTGIDDGKPLLKVTNCHFNINRVGVFMKDVRDYFISGNDFLLTGDLGTIGVRTEITALPALYGEISGNKFDGSNGSGSKIGVHTEGYSGGGALFVHVGFNRYVLLSVGLSIGAYSREVRYHDGSIYGAVTTHVSKSGTASAISKYGTMVVA